MVIQQNCEFAMKATSPIVSKVFFNSTGDTLAVQIQGANGVYHIEGRNSSDSEWCDLAGINLSDFSAARNGYTKAGIYEIGVASIRQIRARIESVEGEVSITGQIISTGEA